MNDEQLAAMSDDQARRRAEFTLRSFAVGSLAEDDMVVALARDVIHLAAEMEQLREALAEAPKPENVLARDALNKYIAWYWKVRPDLLAAALRGQE